MHSCKKLFAKTVPLKKQNYDPLELGFLEICRYVFLSYSNPRTQAWEIALSRIETNFGFANNGRILTKFLGLIQILRSGRSSVFLFSNPQCQCCHERLTDHERLLMDVIGALRMGDRQTARAKALILCEGSGTEPFLTMMDEFWKALAPAKPRLKATGYLKNLKWSWQ